MVEPLKKLTRNSCTLFNKTPNEAFEGGGEKSIAEGDADTR